MELTDVLMPTECVEFVTLSFGIPRIVSHFIWQFFLSYMELHINVTRVQQKKNDPGLTVVEKAFMNYGVTCFT